MLNPFNFYCHMKLSGVSGIETIWVYCCLATQGSLPWLRPLGSVLKFDLTLLFDKFDDLTNFPISCKSFLFCFDPDTTSLTTHAVAYICYKAAGSEILGIMTVYGLVVIPVS